MRSRNAGDLAARPDLVSRLYSTGGTRRLGASTRIGERHLRRHVIIGANSLTIKGSVYPEAHFGTWLGSPLSQKPLMLVRVPARVPDALSYAGAGILIGGPGVRGADHSRAA